MNNENGCKDMQVSSSTLQETTRPTLNDIIKRYNPDIQAYVASRLENAIDSAQVPTLRMLNKEYGRNASAIWLIPHLANLSEFCGCREKLTDGQIRELAHIFSVECAHMKLTQVMYFFYRCKTGAYGKFYGNIDPMTITVSLRKYKDELPDMLFEAEKAKKREEERRREEKADNISFEEYKKMKGMANDEESFIDTILNSFND